MDHLQRHTHTESFRYLAETQATVRVLSRLERPRVLVFGCSIGDEVLPLAAARPDANILAVDINADALAAATTLLAPFSNVHVAMSDWQTIAEFGPFDAVLANSVLCRHPEGLTASVLDALPFAQWDELVAGLVENLAADGLLQVVNSNYRITLASAAERLEPIELPGVQHSGFVPRFLRSGHKAIHIERRRLDDGLDFWLAPSADIDLRTELAPMLYCRRGNELEAIVNLVGAPFRALRAVGPVASRRHEPDGDGPDGTVACTMERRFSAQGSPEVSDAQYFADELLVNGVSIGTRLTPLRAPGTD